MNIVPRVSTPATLEGIALALRDAFAAEFGRPLDSTTAELLTAQILIETSSGQSIKNHSPGNISASSKWSGDAWRPPWFEEPAGGWKTERDASLHAAMLAKKAPSAFRAFASLDDGMRDYVRTLSKQFPTIIAARTPGELARAIHDSGYTRDHKPEAIEPTLAQLVTKIRVSGVYDDLAAATRPDLPKGLTPPAGSSSAPSPRFSFINPPVLGMGDCGPLVVLWQRIVGASDDGLFGRLTEDATRHWQSRQGLPVSGRVTVPCWVVATAGKVVPAAWGQ